MALKIFRIIVNIKNAFFRTRVSELLDAGVEFVDVFPDFLADDEDEERRPSKMSRSGAFNANTCHAGANFSLAIAKNIQYYLLLVDDFFCKILSTFSDMLGIDNKNFKSPF